MRHLGYVPVPGGWQQVVVSERDACAIRVRHGLEIRLIRVLRWPVLVLAGAAALAWVRNALLAMP
jgi:hypothetical protein